MRLKVTVQVGTDQNIEIKTFAEYKYTLNELPVNFFLLHLFTQLRFSIFSQSLDSRRNHSKIRHKHKECQLHEKSEVKSEFYCFS